MAPSPPKRIYWFTLSRQWCAWMFPQWRVWHWDRRHVRVRRLRSCVCRLRAVVMLCSDLIQSSQGMNMYMSGTAQLGDVRVQLMLRVSYIWCVSCNTSWSRNISTKQCSLFCVQVLWYLVYCHGSCGCKFRVPFCFSIMPYMYFNVHVYFITQPSKWFHFDWPVSITRELNC